MIQNQGRIIFGIRISILQQIIFMKKIIKRPYPFFGICLIGFLFSCIKRVLSSQIAISQEWIHSSPWDDFFHYVNGGWIKKTDIPASEATWGAGAILYQTQLKI
jgi:hypothetical protein